MAAMDRPFQSAWQPLTPRGVAAFAGASGGRLLLVQLVFALLAAAGLTWCIHAVWWPTLGQAFAQLPERGEIRSGRLDWGGPAPAMLAEGRGLSLAVDLEHSGDLRGPAHVQVELGRASVRVFSLVGYVDLPYPAGWLFALNRAETVPWWGAWSPAILAGLFVGAVLTLLAVWAALATAYCGPVRLLGFFANRALSLRGAWQLSGAAQMPGAVCLTLAILFYGLDFLDPVRLLVAGGAHFAMTWVYLAISPLTLPPARAVLSEGNPFAGGPGGEPPARGDNPFGMGGR